MITIDLLEGTLQIEVFYSSDDQDLDDNICVMVVESCPPAERVMRAGKTYLYLTPEQARALGEAFLDAANLSQIKSSE